MTYLYISVGIIVSLFIFYKLYKLTTTKNWRTTATVLAAVYSNYKERYDPKKSFVKTLEFRYKPPKIIYKGRSEYTKVDSIHEKLIARYLGVLIAKDLDKIAKGYLSNDPEKARVVEFSHPDVTSVGVKINNTPFGYNQNDYGISELVYCFLVIEHPRVVIHMKKDGANIIINKFLELARNKIKSTTSDPLLIKDMEEVENK